MKLLQIIIMTVLLCVVAFLYGCDSGNEITEVSVVSYPSRIVYIAGIDESVDLSGSILRIRNRDGREHEEAMDYFTCKNNINFERPGVYTIYVAHWVQFPVQVIDPDYINNHLE